jgi:glycosyltransferase involved in cell wall biosynthesis
MNLQLSNTVYPVKRVLLICPCLTLPGGIASYYSSLREHFTYDICYFFIGSRKENESRFLKPANLCRDMWRLFFHLLKSAGNYDLVLLNPSFIKNCIVREGLLLVISKLFDRKCVVFFRGWSTEFADIVSKHYFKLFFRVYNRADSFIVLSSEFRDKLRDWGFKQPIFIETTTVDEKLLDGYTLKQRMDKVKSGNRPMNLLFLSRVEKEKGIIETIDAIKILSKSHPDIRLLVAGVGSYLSSAKKYSLDVGLSDKIIFLGWISGKEKSRLLADTDILLLPSYREGMPNCVLEAMAFGIPVVTRPIGGIKDFFIDGQFGFLTESTEQATIALLVDKIIVNRHLRESMGKQAFNYAHDHFISTSVVRRLEKIFDEII